MTTARNDIEADRLLKPAEAARYLGYSEGTLRNKANAGEIPCVKFGPGSSALRFRRSELDAWIAEQNAAAKGMPGKTEAAS